MPNILYRVSNMNEWIHVANKLQSENDWQPTYWIAHPHQEKKVKELFPNTTFHSKYNANRSIPPEKEFNNTEILDKNILDKYRKYRHIILRVMDRMDPGRTFSYDERVRNYHRSLQYWLWAVNAYDIDLAVFARAPHGVAENIVYYICIEQNIPTIILRPTKLPKICFPNESVHEPNKKLKHMSEHGFTQIDHDNVSEDIKNYIKKVAEKDATHKQISDNTSSYFGKIGKVVKKPTYITNIFKDHNSHNKVGRKTIEGSKPTLIYDIFLEQKARIKKQRLENLYSNLSNSADYSKKYIYFPLHYQPERTTTPDGDVFANQQLVVRLLSEMVPDDWVVYIKEHPVQFSTKRDGEKGRWKYDYQDMNSQYNVNLIDTSENQLKLIDNSEAVATVTGTAGWEAVIRGTPSIVFGNAWYRYCEGVYSVQSKSELSNAISHIQHRRTITNHDILAFVRALQLVGYEGYHSKNWRDSENISSEENINNISQALVEFVESNGWDIN